MKPVVKKFRNRSKSFLARFPLVFWGLYYVLAPQYRDRLVMPDTDIVIEGYPRSANTFAVFAFWELQSAEVKVAHHLHVTPQIELGCRWRRPVLVLVRRPEECVRSLCVRHPLASQSTALQNWMRFYRVVWKHCDRVVIATFDEVVNAFDTIIAQVNDKFHTDFHYEPLDDVRVRLIFSRIERFNSLYDEANEYQVNRPSRVREELYKKFSWKESSLPLLEEANNLYERIVLCKTTK